MCGQSLSRVCRSCGYTNPAGYLFCGMCGVRLEDSSKAGGDLSDRSPAIQRNLPPSLPPDGAHPAGSPFALESGTASGATLSAALPRAPLPSPVTDNTSSPLFAPPAAVTASTAANLTPLLNEPQPKVPSISGERRMATVVLADVVNSTHLLEKLGSEAWVDLMNRIFHVLEAEIYRFGGQVYQFRGDGLIAFFGAAAAHEDDPERAVLAALAMQQARQLYMEEFPQLEDEGLHLRIGVNTGMVIVTSLGDSRQHREDAAMGEAVTLAGQMEAAAAPDTVLVSDPTHRLVQDRFTWQARGTLSITGFSQPIPVYRPLAARPEAAHRREDNGFRARQVMIGRQAEFNALTTSAERLFDGRGGIVLLTGEKGLGKSVLVASLYEHLSRHCVLLQRTQQCVIDPPSWLRGRCRSYDRSTPYSLWLDLLQGWLRESDPSTQTPASEEGQDDDAQNILEDSWEEQGARLHRQALALWGEEDLPRYYPYLAKFLSLPLDPIYRDRVRHLNAEGLRQQIFSSVRSWLEALLRQGPYAILFSDMQWVDTGSLDLLRYCLPLCDSEALLWLLAFRPDRDSPVWEFRHYLETDYPHRLTSVALHPLNEQESGEFIDQQLGRGALPEAVRQLIIKNAEGNPYYIEELLQALIARGVLVQDGVSRRWQATRTVTTLDLPGSLHSLLLSHLDRLSTDERRILQMAAVIGQAFWLDVLQALAGTGIPVKTHLTSLQRAQLIRERGRVSGLGMQYVFRSALMRDAAYESLLNSQRITYHHKIAECLENTLSAEAMAEHCAMLAYHYRHAGIAQKELFYTLQAADRAKKIFANREAVEHYTRALELLDEVQAQTQDPTHLYAIFSRRFEVYNGRHEVYELIGESEASREDAAAMLELAHKMENEPAWLIDALIAQLSVADWRNREEFEIGLSIAQEALALSQKTGDRRREMISLYTIGYQLMTSNDPIWMDSNEKALAIAREIGDQVYESRILTALGIGCAWTDRAELSNRYLAAALTISQALDDRISELQLLDQLGLQLERVGNYTSLLSEFLQKRLEISREIGYRSGESSALIACGHTRAIYLGDLDTGLALLEQAHHMRTGRPEAVYALLRIMQVQIMQGRLESAEKTLEEIRKIDERSMGDNARAGLRIILAKLNVASRDISRLRLVPGLTAEVLQMRAEHRLSTRQYEIAATCELAVSYLTLADVLSTAEQKQEQLDLALAASSQAVELYESLGYMQVIECVSEEVLFRHYQVLLANKLEKQADEYLEKAHAEMMRKYKLIPANDPQNLRQTYLDNIPLHQQIRIAYQNKPKF